MYKEKEVTGIILVAGNSTRYGKDINKNLDFLLEKPTIEYSLDVFANNKYVDNITIVLRSEDEERILNIVDKYRNKNANKSKNIKFVYGGVTRKDSVNNAIKESSSDIVVVHDGARPMIKDAYINNCVEAMDIVKGVTIGVKSKDTIKILDENNMIKNTTVRTNTWITQTPQCFERITLLNETKKCNPDVEMTDDCMILENAGYGVKMIEGDYSNIKLTNYEDKAILERFLNSN